MYDTVSRDNLMRELFQVPGRLLLKVREPDREGPGSEPASRSLLCGKPCPGSPSQDRGQPGMETFKL